MGGRVTCPVLYFECENCKEHSLIASGEQGVNIMNIFCSLGWRSAKDDWDSWARTMQMFGISQWAVSSSCKLCSWSLGLITASSHLPEDAHSAFTLLLLCTFLNLFENREALKPFFSYVVLSHFEISRVLVLSAFKSPSLTQSKVERQHLYFQLVLGFEMNTSSMTFGPSLNAGFVEVLGQSPMVTSFTLWTLNYPAV